MKFSEICQRRRRIEILILAIIQLLVITFIYLIATHGSRNTWLRTIAEIWTSNNSGILVTPCLTNSVGPSKETHQNNSDILVSPCLTNNVTKSAQELEVPGCLNLGPPKSLLILLWHGRLWEKFDDVTLKDKCQCRASCRFTIDSSDYNNSDAVVFTGDSMPLNAFPPSRPSQNQKWIYRTMETPLNAALSAVKRIRIRQQRHLYNLTATFSSLSDVPTPYFAGRCWSSETESGLAVDDELYRTTKRKTRSVAWFVTHCWTSSKREHYVDELQSYIDVDVYGGCGTHRCPFNSTLPNRYQACDDMVERDYRFYLSFENSLCREYVTEKFWRFLHRDVIPIVLGGANYSQFVPAGTYIDVRHYASPRHLADYLKTLVEDDRLYVEYLRRRRRMKCLMDGETFGQRLCRYLHEKLGVTEVRNLDVVWNSWKLCFQPADFYKGVADRIRHLY